MKDFHRMETNFKNKSVDFLTEPVRYGTGWNPEPEKMISNTNWYGVMTLMRECTVGSFRLFSSLIPASCSNIFL